MAPQGSKKQYWPKVKRLCSLAAAAAVAGLKLHPQALGMAAAGDQSAARAPLGVFWDVDGTLVQSTGLGFRGTNAVLRKNGLPEVTEEQYKEGTKYPTAQRFGFHVSGNADDPAGPVLGKQFDDHYVLEVNPSTVPLFAGLADLLKELRSRGCRFAAVSNACTSYVEAVMTATDLSEHFECQLGTDDVEAKPSPNGLLKCAETLGLPADRCVYIGDAPTDGLAAKSAGMRGIGVTWGSHSAEQLRPAFDLLVSTIPELREALQHAMALDHRPPSPVVCTGKA